MNYPRLLSVLAFCLTLSFSVPVSAHGGSGMGMMGQMDDDDYQNRMMQQRGMMGGMDMMGGQGMMGGMGMMNGHGMMGGMGPMMQLDLDDSQRDTIRQMQRDMQKQNWERMGEMMELRHQLQDVMQTENPDPAAAGKIYDKMAKLRKQMFMDRLEARNKMMGKLTDEQREQLRQYRGRGMMLE
ncbi:Spy/CpxP family protein refolding chaperone [Thiohalophilus sp.]|uniref:Spy/CpxP family protein refolding chaperone n=1 Tax=Thiohalophilus sp. TaxID=3028392 RepID=UPI002ACF056C|nr:Spy/CpxP family protein refolding chaperone [Thiohalophilus sp.]MDZ7663242.1 Spy/CpxP family protein refolding chaperone [Thiohalophilus sp.]